eukprot:jgi/Mesvir1/26255/Mv01618-RA.1
MPHSVPFDKGAIYLDTAATTPIYEEVAQAMLPYLVKHFGNPGSRHAFSSPTRSAVLRAREQVAELLNVDKDEVFFTSCGTESNNWAIFGTVARAERLLASRDGPTTETAAQGTPPRLPHVVSSVIEHPAILKCLQYLKACGRIHYDLVPVDAQGQVDPAAVAAAVTPTTTLVTVMHANNETGAIQPIAEIVKQVRDRAPSVLLPELPLLIHTDAAQSVSKVDVRPRDWGVDLCTLVGHKMGAPKGIAALYIRDGAQIDNFLHGGGQEAGHRGGTENVLLIVGLGEAAAIAMKEAGVTPVNMRKLKGLFLSLLTEGLGAENVRVNGHPVDSPMSLPNVLSVGIRGIEAAAFLDKLAEDVAASAGAACHAGETSISSVLVAMNVPQEFARGTLRFSFGRLTTEADVRKAAELVIAARKQEHS